MKIIDIAPLQSFNCIAVHTKHTAKKKIHASSGNRMQIKWLLTPVSLEKSLPGFNKKFQNSWQRYKSVKFTNVFDHIFNFKKCMRWRVLNSTLYTSMHIAADDILSAVWLIFTHIFKEYTHNVNKMCNSNLSKIVLFYFAMGEEESTPYILH